MLIFLLPSAGALENEDEVVCTPPIVLDDGESMLTTAMMRSAFGCAQTETSAVPSWLRTSSRCVT